MTETYFCIALGAYDSGEAVDTLPAQLDYLRTLRDLERPDVALVYRLRSFEDPQGELGVSFRILCVGRDSDTLGPEEQESLQDQISVALLPAWGLLHTDEKPLPSAKCRIRLDPACPPSTLPIKADWTPLVDLLRRRQKRVTVDWVCSSTPHAGRGDSALDQAHPPVLETDHQLDAARFFSAAASQVEDHDMQPLSLRVLVHSDEPIDAVLAKTIGRATLGMPVESTPVRRDILFHQNTEATVSGPPEELIRLFHGPYGRIQGRGLEGSRSTKIPVRFSVPPGDEAAIGTAVRQSPRRDEHVPIRLGPLDRLKHTYVLGKTGSGKTNLLRNIVREDIKAGRGVAVIDPHGDLVDDALRHVSDRLEDVVLLDFGDPDFLPILNPLVVDVETAADRDLAITELLDVIVRRTSSQYTGPVFEDAVRMILSTVSSKSFEKLLPTPTIALGVELLRSSAGRSWVQSALSEIELTEEWATFNGMSPNDVAEHVRWVTAKFTDFGPEGILRPVTSGEDTGLPLRAILEKDQILLVKLPEAIIGPNAAAFLGSLIFSRIHRAALSRGPNQEKPFYLHVDEFQKFVSSDIEGLVAEARKFGLGLTLAHQNLRQLDAFSRFEGSTSSRLREAIFSNVGSIVCMKMSGADVPVLAEEMGVPTHQIRQLAQYAGLARTVVGGIEREPFTLSVSNARDHKGDDRNIERVRKRMIKAGYWGRREVLEEGAAEAIDRMRAAWKKKPAPKPTLSPRKAPSIKDSLGPTSLRDSFNKRRDQAKARADKLSAIGDGPDRTGRSKADAKSSD
jgi:Helicase HerA, central domain